MKMLIDAINDTQEILEIGEGGGYFDPSKVIWDEREDGALPSITLGGMIRDGNSLTFSQPKFDSHSAILLSAAKTAMWDKIVIERTRRANEGGYLAAGNWYHSDQLSRTQQIGLVMLGANLPSGLKWQTMDDGEVSMTQTLAGQIFAAAAASDAVLFSAARTHKVSMEASAAPESYDHMTGWPKAFDE